MTETSSLPMLTVVLTLTLLSAWLLWRMSAGLLRMLRRRLFDAKQPVQGSPYASAMTALGEMPAGSLPDDALSTLRHCLPATDFAALITELEEKWTQSRHPPYLAALVGLALEQIDSGFYAVRDFMDALDPLLATAPPEILRPLVDGLLQRQKELRPWLLLGGLADIRRSASRRAASEPEAAAMLMEICDAFHMFGVVAAMEYAEWRIFKCENEGEAGDPRKLVEHLAYNCRPMLGEPFAIVHQALARHRGDARWRAAALELDAMLVDVYSADDGIEKYDLDAVLQRLREGLCDYDWLVANTAGQAAADIIEAGYLGSEKARLVLGAGLDWSQNIHWPRPPGQERLETLLAVQN